MRSRLGYVLGALLVAGAVVIGVLGFGHVGGTIDAMQRVTMPGEGVYHLPVGQVTFFLEAAGEGHIPNRLSVHCTLGEGPAQVPLDRPTGRTRYGFGGRHGVSVFDAVIVHSGDYPVRCTSDGNRPFIIARGEDVALGIVLTVVGMLLPGLGGIALLVITAIRRHRAARRQRPATVAGLHDEPS